MLDAEIQSILEFTDVNAYDWYFGNALLEPGSHGYYTARFDQILASTSGPFLTMLAEFAMKCFQYEWFTLNKIALLFHPVQRNTDLSFSVSGYGNITMDSDNNSSTLIAIQPHKFNMDEEFILAMKYPEPNE